MKKRKLKIRKLIIVIVILITVIVASAVIIKNLNNGSKKYYSDEAIQVIKKEKLDVYDFDYSKTLDEILKRNLYNEAYLEDYLNIKYIDDDNFIEYVNEYLHIGYNGENINQIFMLSKKNQEKLLNKKKINITDNLEIKDYINIKNFNVDNYDRYELYRKNNSDLDISTVVTYVNINLDRPFYEDSTLVSNPHDLTIIVNKYNHVNKDFVPKNLVALFDNGGAKMVDVAANAYKEFINAAKKDGITLKSTTAYRSYSFQSYLYNNYVKEDGVKKADTYSARPGSSEHQLGLAVDLTDPYVSGKRLSDEDYKWVLNNSYKYGFIVRYTESGVPITGYMEEPWHIRYLGVDLATKVYESGLTYEEYYDLYMMEY